MPAFCSRVHERHVKLAPPVTEVLHTSINDAGTSIPSCHPALGCSNKGFFMITLMSKVCPRTVVNLGFLLYRDCSNFAVVCCCCPRRYMTLAWHVTIGQYFSYLVIGLRLYVCLQNIYTVSLMCVSVITKSV